MKTGEKVADFELLDQHGTPRRLSELVADGPVVIFFYPLAGSGGCTQEACRFRDLETEFAEAGATLVGISTDSPAKQLAFATENRFSYPLLSDPKGHVADQFGVRRRLLARTLPTKRATFIVDAEQTLQFQVASETNMDVHANRALAELGVRAW
ncbi:peroxiredoxin [Arthrobacter glacialis]|uniref:thioredoxin-dependent peroxiredoxin n=1 Tax=Arthrobacter glacialis TaxID=1664 RepID=A0A2S3ZVW9_ARTGL|nr:peroxiredoxin [Arthrobacter glacialis]POH58566.1 peroxiredoxin [Arthrobacter glacialis]POH73368.1 peroxiredoxin [Arthrobacter glacialis]